MYLPTPDEYAKQHGHTPFPPRWERWLSAIRRGILTGQGIAGQNVSVDVHPGEGTVYNVGDSRGRNPISGGRPPSAGCFLSTDAIITLVFSGVIIDGICQSYGTGSFKDSATAFDINTTYNCVFVDTVDCFNVDPCPCSGPANLYNSDLVTAGYHQKEWYDPNITCAGDPDLEVDVGMVASVYCDCTGLTVALAGDAFFYATGITSHGTYANSGAFNSLIHNPYFSDTLKAGHGGSVAISW